MKRRELQRLCKKHGIPANGSNLEIANKLEEIFKLAKRYNPSEDRISRLPDDILVDILSLLSLEEAARTSVLSSRWTNLWKHTTCLNLDGDHITFEEVKSESCEYVSWVDRILRSHKALHLKEFRIRSAALNMRHKDFITEWLEFAFAKQVESLELDLQIYSDPFRFYRFPEELFLAQSFKSLREIIFRNVNVSAGAIELFLSNCPLLEKLIVNRSPELKNLQVCGPSLVLKHLDISQSDDLKSLKVSAPLLTYLRAQAYRGIFLENVPMLVEIDCTCNDTEIPLRRLFSTLACCPQLETLHLALESISQWKKLCNIPQMPKLKKLVIQYLFPGGGECLVTLTAFIRASPCLEEFVLKYEWKYPPRRDRGTKVKGVITSPHHHLKVVKFSGYYGRTSDLEFVTYILNNCVVLEKLIIDPSSPNAIVDVEQTARKNAKLQLGAIMPRSVELVLL